MQTTITKWKCIFEIGMAYSHSHHHHNEPTCKDKWRSLYADLKKYMTTPMSQATMKNIGTCLYKTTFRKDYRETLTKCF
jgi:hypothetical protein